jgi:hypothetical protein
MIVIGAAAGGLEALDTLIGRLPVDLGASIFIVQHMAPEDSSDALTRRLTRHQCERIERSNRQLLGETQGYIDRLRGMLVTAESQSPDDTFTRVKGLMAEPTKAKSTR